MITTSKKKREVGMKYIVMLGVVVVVLGSIGLTSFAGSCCGRARLAGVMGNVFGTHTRFLFTLQPVPGAKTPAQIIKNAIRNIVSGVNKLFASAKGKFSIDTEAIKEALDESGGSCEPEDEFPADASPYRVDDSP